MAKVISFQVPKSQKEFVRYQEDSGKTFYDKLHQHPLFQLTYILEGKGQFLSGDYVGRFSSGDLFFLGENVPHVFRSDPEYFEENNDLRSEGRTVFFDFDALGRAIGDLEELSPLQRFREYAGLCFQVKGGTQEKIIELLEFFGKSAGLKRFQLAIQLLSLFDGAKDDLLQLNQDGLFQGLSEKDGSRMNRVMQYLLDHRYQKISLDDTASVANLSKEAFCRYFKLRTRKTFTQYLLQIRINEAQKLLQETDLGISEIAFQVGFENLSYFNRSFKKITGLTPRDFKRLA